MAEDQKKEKPKEKLAQRVKKKFTPHSNPKEWLDALRGNIDKHFEKIEEKKAKFQQEQQKKRLNKNYNWAKDLENGALKIASYFHPVTFLLNMLKKEKHMGIYEWKPIVGSGMYGTTKPFDSPSDLKNDLKLNDIEGQNPSFSQREEIASHIKERIVSFVKDNPGSEELPFISNALDASSDIKPSIEARDKAEVIKRGLEGVNQTSQNTTTHQIQNLQAVKKPKEPNIGH